MGYQLPHKDLLVRKRRGVRHVPDEDIEAGEQDVARAHARMSEAYLQFENAAEVLPAFARCLFAKVLFFACVIGYFHAVPDNAAQVLLAFESSRFAGVPLFVCLLGCNPIFLLQFIEPYASVVRSYISKESRLWIPGSQRDEENPEKATPWAPLCVRQAARRRNVSYGAVHVGDQWSLSQ